MGIAQGTGHMEGYEHRNPHAAPAAQVDAMRAACLIDPGIHPAALAPAFGQRQSSPATNATACTNWPATRCWCH